MFISLRHQF